MRKWISASGYDIRGEVSCEQGVAALPNRPATVASDRHGIRQAIPIDWRERFIEAYEQEFRKWIVAAGQGAATGPSTWVRLCRDAGRRYHAARRDSGRLERIAMREKRALYRTPVAAAA